jgi:hypothetical protein
VLFLFLSPIFELACTKGACCWSSRLLRVEFMVFPSIRNQVAHFLATISLLSLHKVVCSKTTHMHAISDLVSRV